MTRSGKISPLWQKFMVLWNIFYGLFLIWPNAEPTLANLWHYWAIFKWSKPSGPTGSFTYFAIAWKSNFSTVNPPKEETWMRGWLNGQASEHSSYGKVSLYGWSPVWLVWILWNNIICCYLCLVKWLYPNHRKHPFYDHITSNVGTGTLVTCDSNQVKNSFN